MIAVDCDLRYVHPLLQGRTLDFLSAGANSAHPQSPVYRIRTNMATRNSPAKPNTMLDERHLVFPAGATAFPHPLPMYGHAIPQPDPDF